MICSGCFDDVDWDDIVYNDGEDLFCEHCWENPMIKEPFLKRKEYYEKIGHTGSDMCGCQMCARKADQKE